MAMLEALESRQLLSSPFPGSQPPVIHPAPRPPKPVVGKPGVGPAPAPNPPPNPAPTPATGLADDWAGDHSTSDQQLQGAMQLRITRTSTGEFHALLKFTGPAAFEHKARIQFNPKTGRFALTVFSVKRVICVRGVLTGDGDGGTKLVGGVCFYTRAGAYKARFDLRRAG